MLSKTDVGMFVSKELKCCLCFCIENCILWYNLERYVCFELKSIETA